MMKKSIMALGFATALALASTAAQAQNMSTSRKNAAADRFMSQAIEGDLAEIQMGKLAQQNGATDQVKQFGQRLVSDHSADLQKAKSVAQSMGMNPPTAPDAKQRADYQKMSKLSGAKFDRQFARDMVRDHKKDISKFKRESKKSGAAANYAQQALPVLEQHLQMAESLNSSKTTGSAR